MRKNTLLTTLAILPIAVLATGCANPFEGHEFTYHAAQEATCTKDGNIAYCTCSYCDDLFDPVTHKVLTEEQVYTPRLGHKFNTFYPATESTCSEHGMKAHYVCEECGAFANSSKQSASESSLLLPYAHELSYCKEVSATYSETGIIAHYHCSKCNRDFIDNKGEKEELDLRIPKLSSFDPNFEFNNTGTTLPYKYLEKNDHDVVMTEVGHGGSAASALFLALKEGQTINKRFTLESKVKIKVNGDCVGLGLYAPTLKADGNRYVNLYGLQFGNSTYNKIVFSGTAMCYGEPAFNHTSEFPHSFSDFNFEGTGEEGWYAFKMKLVRDDIGVTWYVNDKLCGTMKYADYPNNIEADMVTYPGLMFRDHNGRQQGAVDDTCEFYDWSLTNNAK